MAFFGSDWLDDYDSMEEYELRIGHSNEKVRDYYDKPIGAPIHIEDDYDSMEEYEKGIKHFKE